MKRAILVALGIGVVVSSAAALGIGKAPEPTAGVPGTRAEQRTRIDERYLAERERCASLGGYQRDRCLVKAHANRGRAMLEAARPYEVRF